MNYSFHFKHGYNQSLICHSLYSHPSTLLYFHWFNNLYLLTKMTKIRIYFILNTLFNFVFWLLVCFLWDCFVCFLNLCSMIRITLEKILKIQISLKKNGIFSGYHRNLINLLFLFKLFYSLSISCFFLFH